MLRLQKLQLQLKHQIFTGNNKQINLRISISSPTNRLLKYTLQPSKHINHTKFTWSQQLAIPDIYSKMGIIIDGKKFNGYIFKIWNDQIFQRMTKGKWTDKQEIIGEGRIIVNQNQNKGEWNIVDNQGNVLGKLTAQIITSPLALAKKFLSSNNNLSTINQQPFEKVTKKLRILSLVSRIQQFPIKLGYFCVQIGNTIIKTPQIKSKAGQLVFLEPRQVQLQQENKNIQIKIYSLSNSKSNTNDNLSSSLTSGLNQNKKKIHNEQKQNQPFAQAVLSLVQNVRSKKVKLMKDGFQVGQLYVQYRIINKQLVNTTNHVQNINKPIKLQPFKQLEQTLMKFRPPNTSPLTLTPIASAYASLDTSLIYQQPYSSRISLQKRQSSSSKRYSSNLNQSSVSKSTNRRMNSVSVLNHNKSIIFPKQKRFVLYQDKQNQTISYLDEKIRGLEYSSIQGGQYRGASIGIGGKTDFATGKSIPGVGHYKLPSIWDRY